MISNAFLNDADASPLTEGLLNRADAPITRYVPIAPRRSALKGLTRRFVQVTVPGLFLSLAACGGNVEPIIQFNPDPSMRHEVTFHIDDPRITFDRTEATAHYQVTNETCVPRDPVSGVHVLPTKALRLETVSIDGQTYRVTVMGDALRDEDYFGLGRCHWSLTSVSLSATVDGSTIAPSVTAERIFSGSNETVYFPKAALSWGPSAVVESGSNDIRAFGDPRETFTIAVRTKAVAK